MARNYAILGFTIGYLGTIGLWTMVAYFILKPFSIGYIGAELVGSFYIWSTVYNWDTLNQLISDYLEVNGL